MEKHQQQALQVAKEIVVKFIEVGRVSPQNIGEIFPTIYDQVLEAISKDLHPGAQQHTRGSKDDREA